MNVLVVGGGISGISAAKVALKAHHNVIILEQESEPGGLMARIANCRIGFKTFFDEIRDDPRLTVVKDARIIKAEKRNHVFTVTLEDGRAFEVDRVIVATGLTPYDPTEYKGKRILTSLEYDALIDQRKGELPADFDRIAFVLCVGSRSQEYPLCSSVCCSYTVREIKWTLQRAKPDITVFYNDLRFFGQEFYMEKAYRDAGVRFVRANSRYFEEDESGVTVRYFSGGELHEERFSYVVLAIGLRPNPRLKALGEWFGFSLNEFGFIKEKEPLMTDAEGVYASGGALEPMNIKDSILTGFGAAIVAVANGDLASSADKNKERLYSEPGPQVTVPQQDFNSCLFYLAAEDPGGAVFYEYISSRFLELARELKIKGKTVYVVTKNLVTPSYGELVYEQARREGVMFIHLEEGEDLTFDKNEARVTGLQRDISLKADVVIRSGDYDKFFQDKEFLSVYRSEPQLRWSPTKWGRKRYHAGFIRHPRDLRWEGREILGAIGEMLLDAEEERVFPEVNEERCSGCGSCKEACPQRAIEMEIRERSIALFGPRVASGVPVARVKEDTCVGCGLCVSTCPSDVIGFKETPL